MRTSLPQYAIALTASFAIVATSPAIAQSVGPSVVSTDWVARHLDDPSVVIIQVVHDPEEFAAGHITGARMLPYEAFATARDGNGTELPSDAQIVDTFETLGISDGSRVVLYTGMNGMAPMASRAFLTLDRIGFTSVSMLDGGLSRWRAEARPVTKATVSVARGKLTPHPRDVTVDAAWVNERVGRKGVAFIDTRTTPEYLGDGERHGLRSDGHIAGARQLEWEQLFANADSSRFLPVDAVARLFAERSAPGDTIVTYCLVGYRASMTYFAARLAGLPVRLYDGSYEDWSRRKLPVKKGATP